MHISKSTPILQLHVIHTCIRELTPVFVNDLQNHELVTCFDTVYREIIFAPILFLPSLPTQSH